MPYTSNVDQLILNVRRACVAAVNDTVGAAADDARVSHAWVDRPTRFSPAGGQLESEIKAEHAKPGRNPTGRFGATRRRGFVGLFHEEGTSHEFARPFLRPAADRHFATLAGRIRRRLK